MSSLPNQHFDISQPSTEAAAKRSLPVPSSATPLRGQERPQSPFNPFATTSLALRADPTIA